MVIQRVRRVIYVEEIWNSSQVLVLTFFFTVGINQHCKRLINGPFYGGHIDKNLTEDNSKKELLRLLQSLT